MARRFYLRHSDYEVFVNGKENEQFASNITIQGYTSGINTWGPIIMSMAPQTTGKVILTGVLGDGTSLGMSLRINADGSLDTSYSSLVKGNDIYVVRVAPSGKIYLGKQGNTFTVTDPVDGFTRSSSTVIVRLNSDGTPDSRFNANTDLGSEGQSDKVYGSYNPTNDKDAGAGVYDIDFYSDSGHVAVGGFRKVVNPWTDNVYPCSVMKLTADGAYDVTFMTNIGSGFDDGSSYGVVYAVKIQSDGKILLGGNFTTFNNNTRNRLMRLNSDGTEDTSFYTNLGTGFSGGEVRSIIILSDGKILVGGSFTSLNGNTYNGLVKLNSDGTVDTSFSSNVATGFNNTVLVLKELFNHQILVGGRFTTYNGNTRLCLIRLNQDGTEDIPFYTNLEGSFTGQYNHPSFNVGNYTYGNGIRAICHPYAGDNINGDLLIAGNFTAFDGLSRKSIIKLTGYVPRPYPYRIFTNLNPKQLINDDQLTYSKKLYIIAPKTIDEFSTETIIAKNDSPVSLEDFKVSRTDHLYGTIYSSGRVLIKAQLPPDEGDGIAIKATLQDWEDAGYTAPDYFVHIYEILFKLNDCIDMTTEQDTNLHDNWVVLFLYNQGDDQTFIVLVYQGNDPQAEEVVYIA